MWARHWPAAAYTITASAGNNGAISPDGPVGVAYGANQTFDFTSAATTTSPR